MICLPEKGWGTLARECAETWLVQSLKCVPTPQSPFSHLPNAATRFFSFIFFSFKAVISLYILKCSLYILNWTLVDHTTDCLLLMVSIVPFLTHNLERIGTRALRTTLRVELFCHRVLMDSSENNNKKKAFIATRIPYLVLNVSLHCFVSLMEKKGNARFC